MKKDGARESEEHKSTVGIFGGSFNPIHNGHIAVASLIRSLAGLDEVWIVVSPQNPLKQNIHLLDDTRRLEIVREALVGYTFLKVCDYEFHMPKPSYMWLTLNSLSHDYPHNVFTLIIGSDNWKHFSEWFHGDDILKRYNIAVYPRRYYPVKKEITASNVHLYETPLINISSTMIRERIREGKNIHGLVPERVEDKIIAAYGGKMNIKEH